MNIEQKDIDKLSQLDRIEFEQSCSNIRDISHMGFVKCLFCFIVAIFFLLSDSLIFSLFIWIGGLVIFFGSIVSAAKKSKELDLKYFKINSKDRKK